MKKESRIEKDSMGELQVPSQAYYGIQTQRAVENFPISGWPMPPRFIHALGRIKRAAARANLDLGLLDKKLADAIVAAATEVTDGKLDDQFPVDVFQTGSATSTNMNANEVIASRANEFLGGQRGDKSPVHPNDHVNLCQSSNDVVPTAMHLSTLEAIHQELLPALQNLCDELAKKAKAFDDILKIGRTHLQDATPVRLGQEFGGYASQMDHAIRRIKRTSESLHELALGGTATGTGINAHAEFAKRAIAKIAQEMKLPLYEAKNHFEAQGARDEAVEVSGALRCVAVSMSTIANNIRLMALGPRCGIAEIKLPAVQPGSSIMPGKVNPVILESVRQVAAHVIGSDLAITLGGLESFLELNVGMPLMATHLLVNCQLLANVARVFAEKCVRGIEADAKRCESLIELSLAMCTALAPKIGYDKAAAIAKKAHQTGKTVREIAKMETGLSDKELADLLELRPMTEPGIRGKGGE